MFFLIVYGHANHLEFQIMTILYILNSHYINANCETVKIDDLISEKMSFDFFHEWMKIQPKLQGNFHKNFICVTSTLSSIILPSSRCPCI